jgi:predicted O-methyltransferase YrrM
MQAKDLPQYDKLKGLIPAEELTQILENEVIGLHEQYQEWLKTAKNKIPEVKLYEIFSPSIEQRSIHLENFLGKWGNISTESLCKLCLIVRDFSPASINIFEFGTYNGMTTLQIANNMECNSRIYTLDLPPETKASMPMSKLDEYVSNHFEGKMETTVGSYFKGTSKESLITQLFGDSATFDFSPYYGQMDLIIIDACHSYEMKKIDTDNAFKMAKDKAIIIWDNYHDDVNPYVTKFLGELDIPLYHLKNTNFVIHKKGF